MLTENMTQAYLDRISFTGPARADRATLDALARRHQCSVPFETVMLHRRGAVPDLDVDVLFDKVVTRRLGGYCFELNKLFEELLRALGFDARPVFCRSVRGRDARMPINHRGVLIRLDEGDFFVDVGFGGPMPAGALLLANGAEQHVAGELYTPRRVDRAFDRTWWQVERVTHAARDLYDDEAPERCQVELELCTAAVEDIDFNALNLFCAQPGTLFRDHEVANLRTADGYLGLKDGVLTRRAGGQKKVTELPDRAAVDEALVTFFGMKTIRNWPAEG
ncbi:MULTISPECIES: arylamine N-acetyltransferase [unclassified Adlercreutzia]|uniref:arylamine N-acetyltransferase family protein n=1 Tax=unclassified Adlercreutzia TaxID=2636013 RepID=UPI0013EE3F16|nr:MULTISPECIES: arylamine N-acetyltransferase [unclassified Adlercreutzia]